MSDYMKLGRDMLRGRSILVWHNEGDTSYATHRHDYFEIIYYKNCHGICVLNGEEFSLEDDAVFFMTPQDYHRIEARDFADSSSVVVSFAENAIDSELLRSMPVSPRVLHHASEFLKRCLERLTETFVIQKKKQDLENKYLLNEILTLVLQEGEPLSQRSVCDHPLIAKTIMHILTDISAPADLKTISVTMGISQCYFSELFHKEMGTTFTKWLNRVRVDKALHLLEETEESVLEIAMDCGYNNVSHFIRTFRNLNGCTPSEYRNKNRKHG